MDNYLLTTSAPSIKEMHYMSRLVEVYQGISNTLEALSHPAARDQIYSKMTAGIDDLAYSFIDPGKVGAYGGLATAKSVIDKHISSVKESIRKTYVEDYKFVILNQGLVMLCTVFETFMNDSLWTITSEKPEVLNQLSPRKELKLDEIISLKSYESILATFQDKTIEHFSRQGIKKQLEDLDKIGLSKDKIFDYAGHKPEVKQKYGAWGFEKLEEIFQKRHDVVHKDRHAVSSIEELYDIMKFLETLIGNMSFLFFKKFRIPYDFLQFLVDKGVYQSKEELMKSMENYLK